MKPMLLYILLAALVLPLPAHAGTVVATIKPLHSLVAGVMEGDGNALVLLVDSKASPHAFTLKPSQVKALQRADIVFFMGQEYEFFLNKVWETLPSTVRRAPMEAVSGLTLYPVRLGDDFAQYAQEEESGTDLHLWMAPANAKLMVAAIAQQLSEIYPDEKARYARNAKKLSAKIDALDADVKKRMQRLQGKPFIVFHDAYQYFEKSNGLRALDAVTLHPEQGTSAKHLLKIRESIKATGAACIFREPSFDARVVDNILKGTSARGGVLDPEGALLDPGPELYFQLMEGIAAGLERCLLG